MMSEDNYWKNAETVLSSVISMTLSETGYGKQKMKKKPDTTTIRKTSFSKKRMLTA